MPRLPCQCVVVDESSRHLARVSAALRAAQCTMDDPTMARSWLSEKHQKKGGGARIICTFVITKHSIYDGKFFLPITYLGFTKIAAKLLNLHILLMS